MSLILSGDTGVPVTTVTGTLPVANGGTGTTSTTFTNLTTNVTGTLPVANGGTGVTTAGTSGNVLTSNGTTWASVATLQVAVRQTVLQSPVSTSGYPSFLASTFAGLVASTQNVSTGVNSLVVTAAQGSGLSGDINVVGQSTANLTWPAATASNTNYLPISISGGVLTAATPVILAPIYQWGGTPSVTSGQYTFNIQQMTMYLGNGSTAPAVNHVIVGQVVAGASTITSTVAYALMGKYRSADTAIPASSTRTAFSANIGVPMATTYALLRCITTQNGYAVGEYAVPSIIRDDGSYVYTYNFISPETANTISLITANGGSGLYVPNKGTPGNIATITAANWTLIMFASRGW